MKCKQAADPATAKALETAILNLYRAYEGKEPQFSQTDAAGAIPASAHAGHDHGDHAHEHGDHDHGHDHGDHEHGDHKN